VVWYCRASLCYSRNSSANSIVKGRANPSAPQRRAQCVDSALSCASCCWLRWWDAQRRHADHPA
jgi:hypothetical protein